MDMLILILQVMTGEGRLQGMSLLFQVDLLVGCQSYRTLLLYPAEAEYLTASHACKEAIWLKGLFGEFGRMQDKVKLLCDSQSAINLAKNPTYHSKTKHIPIKYHFVR